MKLVVALEERIAGHLEVKGSRPGFTYDAQWLAAAGSYPVSASLPLQAAAHTGARVNNFLWGLLPDNERTLESWARRFQVSARNPVALLANVGEDCAGAVQFLTEARAQELLSVATAGKPQVAWLSETELADRIRRLAGDGSAGRVTAEEGQFSLGGAQAKTALLYDHRRNRWGIPSGRTPTTHILKPAANEYAGFAENEHFCLELARAAGLAAAQSSWRVIGGVPTLISRRYDRVEEDGRWHRVHQEDACQALGIHPERKYENQGGPGFPALIRTLETADDPQADRERLMRSACFMFLVGATDAHAKNFSLLHARGTWRPSLRLAPLYDVASAWPYRRQLPRQKLKLAMRVGSHYRVDAIQPRHFEALAKACHYPARLMLAHLSEFAQRLPDESSTIAAELTLKGMNRAIVKGIVDGIARQCAAVQGQVKTMSR